MTRPVQCIDEQALGDVLALPQSDPRRRHVDECPRCRALAVSYREFLDPSEEVGSYGSAEDSQLTDFREHLTGVASAPAGPTRLHDANARAAAPARGTDGEPRSWSERLFAPALRPVWAIAAIVIAFGVMRIAPQSPPGSATAPVLRGGSAHELATATPSYAANRVTLVWSAHPEADRYQLRFFSTALAEIGRRDLGRDTSVTLAIGDLPAAYAGGETILWRVVALKAGDELESSAPGSLKQP
jgi:hypothetical protein